MPKLTHLIPSLLILILIFALTTLPVQAKSFSLAVSPPVTEVISRPGTTIEIPISVTNHSETTDITLLPQLFTSQDQLGHVNPTTDKSPALTWLSVAKPTTQTGTYPLLAGQTTQFTLILNIPVNTPNGDHQIAIFFQSTTPDTISGSSQTGTLSIGRIASLLLLTISSSPTIDSSASIQSLSIPRLVDSFSPLTTTLLIKNTGPHLTKLAGSLSLEHSLTHSKYLTPLAHTNILTNSNRYLLASPSAELTTNQPITSPTSPLARLLSFFPALYTNQSAIPPNIDLNKPSILLGPYSLSANLYPVNATGELTATVNIIALPYKLIVFLALFGLLIYFIFYLYRHYQQQSINLNP